MCMESLLLWDKRYNCKKFENEADFGVSEPTPLVAFRRTSLSSDNSCCKTQLQAQTADLEISNNNLVRIKDTYMYVLI